MHMLKISKIASRNKGASLFVVLTITSLVFLIAGSNTIRINPKQLGFSFLSVIQRGFTDTGRFFARTVNSIGELKKLKQEYTGLQKEMDRYRVIERDLVELKQENTALRNQLDFADKLQFEKIPAEITAKDPGNLFSAIIIDKGSIHGIKVDMPVIAYQDGFHGLIGKVVEVGPVSSKIKPVFDRSCFVAARLQDSRFDGLVYGLGLEQDFLIMQYVKKHARNEIKYGDLVITSGMQSLYPKGIYIGRVRAIHAKEYEPSLNLDLEPVIDFSRLEFVFVLGNAQ